MRDFREGRLREGSLGLLELIGQVLSAGLPHGRGLGLSHDVGLELRHQVHELDEARYWLLGSLPMRARQLGSMRRWRAAYLGSIA